MTYQEPTTGLSRMLIAGAIAGALGACATAPPVSQEPGEAPIPRPGEDPFNIVYTARIEGGEVVETEATPLPEDAFSHEPFELDKETDGEAEPEPPSRIHPLLERWLEERDHGERERLVVNFVDELEIPRFPEPDYDGDRDSAANREARQRAEELIAGIEQQRATDYEELAAELAESYSAEVLESFWLIRAVVAEMPLGAALELAQREDVLYLEPDQTEDPPPQNANNADDVADGRRWIASDPYFDLGLAGGWIALLDTGVRGTHELFNRPDRFLLRYDCVNGGPRCNNTRNRGYSPDDDCWDHGTSSAGILSANDRHGDAFRGVTAITIDSFKVYPRVFTNGVCRGFLVTAAAVRGFQRAVAELDRVIVAEMQGSGNYLSAISTAADRAFDAGAVVVAANGNFGPNARTVATPASAHRALGVGGFDVESGAQYADQSRGPTQDRRFKPDIQAPTNTETASSASDTAFQVFGGTSGATPYAAGAAALLRNWMLGSSRSIDPGHVYAMMILSGQNPYPFDNTKGAGQLRLPTNGRVWPRNKVWVGPGGTINIPIQVRPGANLLDAALWWPESAFRILSFTVEHHNDIDLRLVDPAGTERASSITIPGVFERVRVRDNIQPGTWRLQIRGYRVGLFGQTVYWAAATRR